MKKLLILLGILSLIRFFILITKQKPKRIVKTFLQSLIYFTAASLYLLPLNDNLLIYRKSLKKIPFTNWLLIELPKNKKVTSKSLIVNKSNRYTDLITNFLSKSSIIIFVIAYFLIIKLGKKLNVPYFIRYNMMHSVLISLSQIPITHCYKILAGFKTINYFVKNFIETITLSMTLCTFFILLYGSIVALVGIRLYFPIFTDSTYLHLGDPITIL